MIHIYSDSRLEDEGFEAAEKTYIAGAMEETDRIFKRVPARRNRTLGREYLSPAKAGFLWIADWPLDCYTCGDDVDQLDSDP
jgi:hypothetical protein